VSDLDEPVRDGRAHFADPGDSDLHRMCSPCGFPLRRRSVAAAGGDHTGLRAREKDSPGSAARPH